MNFYRLKIIGNKLHTIERNLEFSNHNAHLSKAELKTILHETHNSKIQLDNLLQNQSYKPNNELSLKLKNLYKEIKHILYLTKPNTFN